MIEGSRWSSRAGGTQGPIVSQTQQDLYDQALQTDDLAERERLYDELGREMIADAYLIPLANPNLILAYRSNLQGMHYSGCCNVELVELYRTTE
jgi:peptide/nickel transport system substrate-binding protein